MLKTTWTLHLIGENHKKKKNDKVQTTRKHIQTVLVWLICSDLFWLSFQSFGQIFSVNLIYKGNFKQDILHKINYSCLLTSNICTKKNHVAKDDNFLCNILYRFEYTWNIFTFTNFIQYSRLFQCLPLFWTNCSWKHWNGLK